LPPPTEPAQGKMTAPVNPVAAWCGYVMPPHHSEEREDRKTGALPPSAVDQRQAEARMLLPEGRNQTIAKGVAHGSAAAAARRRRMSPAAQSKRREGTEFA